MKLKIEVTQEDIDHGKRWDRGCCMVAMACKRVFDLDTKVACDRDDRGLVIFDVEAAGQLPQYKEFKLPEIAAKMVEFDRGTYEGGPFSFEVDF